MEGQSKKNQAPATLPVPHGPLGSNLSSAMTIVVSSKIVSSWIAVKLGENAVSECIPIVGPILVNLSCT